MAPVGRPLSARLAACSCTSARSSSPQATRTAVPTVFSCVASRNKRCPRAPRNGSLTLLSKNPAPHQSRADRKSIAVRRQQRAQRAPSSCSPPHEVAADCATLRVAQHSAQSTAQFSAPFGLSPIPPRRFAPGRQGRRPCGSRKLCHKHRPVSASLRLRYRSATFSRRPRQFLPDWLIANRQNMPSYAGGRRSSFVLFFVRAPWATARDKLRTG